VFPFLYCVLPWIHFYDSSLTTSTKLSNGTIPGRPKSSDEDGSLGNDEAQVQARNPRKDKMRPKYKFKAVDRVQFYFTAPVTKFHYSMVGISCFTDVLRHFMADIAVGKPREKILIT